MVTESPDLAEVAADLEITFCSGTRLNVGPIVLLFKSFFVTDSQSTYFARHNSGDEIIND